MNRHPYQQLQEDRRQLQEAETELEALEQGIASFEAQVDARLGVLLDQLSELNAVTLRLDAELRYIREKRLFGADLMQYTAGAPRPARATDLDDLPPLGLNDRSAIHQAASDVPPGVHIPDIKLLYRKLARRYHPDLARSDADRAQSNQLMAEVNQAYNAGDLPQLMQLGGMILPYGVDISQVAPQKKSPPHGRLSEAEQVNGRLQQVRQQIIRLGDLPIVRLSLEVKLKRHQGRDLLGEMASELHYKVARKLAERDYLHSQIKASEKTGEPGADQP